MDEKDECKGFAFVEFEDEVSDPDSILINQSILTDDISFVSKVSALKSLELNNFELKKRRMSVVIAQSRAAGVQK